MKFLPFIISNRGFKKLRVLRADFGFWRGISVLIRVGKGQENLRFIVFQINNILNRLFIF